MRPATLWHTLHVRVPPDVVPLVQDALNRFWQGQPRPATQPVALGVMLEALAADYLAGPEKP